MAVEASRKESHSSPIVFYDGVVGWIGDHDAPAASQLCNQYLGLCSSSYLQVHAQTEGCTLADVWCDEQKAAGWVCDRNDEVWKPSLMSDRNAQAVFLFLNRFETCESAHILVSVWIFHFVIRREEDLFREENRYSHFL